MAVYEFAPIGNMVKKPAPTQGVARGCSSVVDWGHVPKTKEEVRAPERVFACELDRKEPPKRAEEKQVDYAKQFSDFGH